MKEHEFILKNLGMRRDLSISKVGESSAYENRNIRITATDKDTLLSVTNERGNKRITYAGGGIISGNFVGGTVLNNHIILFTTGDEYDYIYRIDYTKAMNGDDVFTIIRGNKTTETNKPLFKGNLGLRQDRPIECICYYETDDIQKVYWVDGQNVLRFINIMEELKPTSISGVYVEPWEGLSGSTVVTTDNTYFDSNRASKFSAKATVTKDNSGNTRANGVVQYLLTYFNKHGQETGYVWVSDLVYLSPVGRGGAADETNNNRVLLTFTNLDTSFTHFRVYSIFRSSLNGQTVAYLVSEQRTSSGSIYVEDDGAHLTVQDATRLLYLGSKPVVAGTFTHKDQTLFLGDLRSTGRASYDAIDQLVHTYLFQSGSTWESGCITFLQTDDSRDEMKSIPTVANIGVYPYQNQLSCSSSEILSFKGGEKYRFALKFTYRDGTDTDAFWIGDKENPLYPVIDTTNNRIKRIVARCTLPAAFLAALKNLESGFEFGSVQLLMAEATYADRSVKAQGIVNPTMFNTWERFNNRVYAVPSWVTRPRNSPLANRHFASVENSTSSAGEIQCNYWPPEDGAMLPYFRYKDLSTTPKYSENFQGQPDFQYVMLVYNISPLGVSPVTIGFSANVRIITGNVLLSTQEDPTALTSLQHFKFKDSDFKDWAYVDSNPDDAMPGYYIWNDPSERVHNPDGSWATRFQLKARYANAVGKTVFISNWEEAATNLYSKLNEELNRNYDIPMSILGAVTSNQFKTWCGLVKDAFKNGTQTESAVANPNRDFFFTKIDASTGWIDAWWAMNNSTGSSVTGEPSENRWSSVGDVAVISSQGEYTPAYAKKNIMFVDENVVTLDSPELAQEAVSVDGAGLSFRIVGVAKVSSILSDYTIDATSTSILGTPYDKEQFSESSRFRQSVMQGISSWPLWKEYGLQVKEETLIKEQHAQNTASPDRDIDDYKEGSNIVRYWMYMWQHSGVISGFSTNFSTEEETEDENSEEQETSVTTRKPSVLNEKTFANLRFCYNTIFVKEAAQVSYLASENTHLRVTNELNNSYYTLEIGSEKKYYEGVVQLPLTMPWMSKYPIFYSRRRPESTATLQMADTYYLKSNSPVMLEYRSGTHAVISLPSASLHSQTVLPRVFSGETLSFPSNYGNVSGALIPWDGQTSLSSPNTYQVTQSGFTINSSTVQTGSDLLYDSEQYLFIGEIYKDFTGNDTRYGGITEAAVRNNRFIPAGPMYDFSALTQQNTAQYIYANQGDTYFQRWDCVRTKPYSKDSENKAIDIVSFMVETHINLDGRSDLYRGNPKLTSINLEAFGTINPVYSQKNNFSVKRDLDTDYNTDAYRSSLTWTLPKSDMADVDEWSHITLAGTLKLDSDKGICRGLRRFNNSIIAFQDRAISEVLFNSRTQLTSTDGVPIEIGNSGKVDGKRYISEKYGCINKWSIAEGKKGLYFVDNINKAFCAFSIVNGRAAVENVSNALGFSAWFKSRNTMELWTPDVAAFDNIISFYDKERSDVYLIRRQPSESDDPEAPALVFNENLGTFTSFFDYGSVPMMANVEDKFISFKSGLWVQNEGIYGNFFGMQKPFWVQYRVTPDPYGDKIWANVEWRADFYRVLDTAANGYKNLCDDSAFIDERYYQPNETFDYMKFWNEYQSTNDSAAAITAMNPVKKFRTWRMQIPRAKVDSTYNPYGLDRIRNPWLNLMFKKNYSEPASDDVRDMMQLHDITVKYFE